MKKSLLSILVLGMASSAIAQITIPSTFQGRWIKAEAFAQDRHCLENYITLVNINSDYVYDVGSDVTHHIKSLKTISNKAIVLTTRAQAVNDAGVKNWEDKIYLNILNKDTLSINKNTFKRCLDSD